MSEHGEKKELLCLLLNSYKQELQELREKSLPRVLSGVAGEAEKSATTTGITIFNRAGLATKLVLFLPPFLEVSKQILALRMMPGNILANN